MLIRGEWQLRDDGAMRPIVRAHEWGRRQSSTENFLIDSGADRTVLSAVLVTPCDYLPRAHSLAHLAGLEERVAFCVGHSVVEFISDDGRGTSPRRIAGLPIRPPRT